MRSCVIVLIGTETASRKWVQYEIKEAWKRGKGIVGIYINKLKNSQGEQSQKGDNPLKMFCVDETFNYIVQHSEPRDEHEINLGDVCTTFESIYQLSDYVYDDIKENIVDGDISTYFHSSYDNSNKTPFPHEYIIDLGGEKTFNNLEIWAGLRDNLIKYISIIKRNLRNLFRRLGQ